MMPAWRSLRAVTILRMKNTLVGEEDAPFQVGIGFDIIVLSNLLTADVHLQDRSNDGSETIQVSAQYLTSTI